MGNAKKKRSSESKEAAMRLLHRDSVANHLIDVGTKQLEDAWPDAGSIVRYCPLLTDLLKVEV
jgi:hypothetical protein